MKAKNILSIILISLFVLPIASIAQKNYKSTSLSTLSVYGTSTLHDWHMKLDHLNCTAQFTVNDSKLESIDGFNFSCNSKGLKSGKNRMDDLAWEALKADAHPKIIASFHSLKLFTPDEISFKAIVMSNVTIAGVTILTPIAVKGEYHGDKIKVVGNKEINMSDYNMEPPTAMMGTIKTGDKITIAFIMEFIQN